MRYIILILIILLLNGCVGATVREAIDEADKHVRLKWNEEWKPAIKEEIKDSANEAKDSALKEAILKIEKFEQSTDNKFKMLNIKPSDHDLNKDGKLQTREALSLLKELKAKNDDAGNPLEWWELLLLVAGAYLPATGAKEILKSKISKPQIDKSPSEDK